MEYSRYEQPGWPAQQNTATNAGAAIAWMLVGIGIGAGMALLLAPTSGRELRTNIGRGLGRTWGGLSRGTQELRQRGSNLLNISRWRSGEKLQER